MAVRGGKKVSVISRGGMRLRSMDAFRDSVLFLDAVTTAPTTTTGIFSLYVSGTSLIYDNGSATTTIGAAGGGGTPTWETIFAADNTFTITPDATFTITGNRSTATDVLTVTNIAGGSGSAIQITNSGTGNDIDGTSNLWGVTAAGVASFAGLTLTGANTITTSSGDITWTLEDNDSTALIIGASGDTNMMTFDTSNAAPVVRFGDGMALTDGAATFDSSSNTVSNVVITNNTITTFGADTNSTGMVVIRSTSLTTGSLLQLQASDTALAGGFYLTCRDSVGAANNLTIGENGVIAMVGTAASDSLAITNGDVLVSDGSLTMTDADNAASFSLTNNTATTARVFLVTGSGVHTGTGATAFYGITQSGATSGDVVAITANGLTTGNALLLTSTGTVADGGAMLSIVADSATTPGATAGGLVELTADALTTGVGMDLTTTSLALAAGGLFNAAHTASGTLTAAKTAWLAEFFSSRTHTAASAISDDYDVVSIIRTNVINNAGGTLNAAGSVLRLENIGTQTAGTLADTAIGLEVVMTGGTTQDGVGISLTHTGTTAGRAMELVLSHTTLDGVVQVTANSVNSGNAVVVDLNGLTSGIGLELTHTTTVITTGSVCRITSTGVDTGTAQGTLLDLVSSGTTAGTVVQLVADALATGIGVFMSFDGLTTGEAISITHTTTVIADGGSLFRLSSTGIDTGGATNGTVFDLSSTAQAAGVVALLTANGLTTGTALRVTSSGTVTSAGEGLVNIVGTGVTTGFGLKIDLTEATLTTGLYINCYDDTATASVFTVAEDGNTTITGAGGSNMFTMTAGDMVLSDGSITITDADNAATVSLTNNTATTIGAAASGGVATLISTSLTTGALLNLELTEATLTTGWYLRCWDATGAVGVFNVEEDGEILVAGGRATTAGGADAINIGSSNAIKVLWGSGAPTATAPQGSLYLRTDGSSTSTRLYANSDGAGTWVNFTSAS